jgi:hypothetical protein
LVPVDKEIVYKYMVKESAKKREDGEENWESAL